MCPPFKHDEAGELDPHGYWVDEMTTDDPIGGDLTDYMKVQVRLVPGQNHWWQMLDRAFFEVTKTKQGRALYGDPDRGATVAQGWRTSFLLTGVDSVCLAVDSLPEEETEGITRLVRFPRDQVINLLTQVFDRTDAVSAYESDGNVGHVVTVVGWDSARSRFIYHDPWPGDSLLAAGNNQAGVAAMEEKSGDWSVTREEMTKVIQAAFLFPSTWAQLTGNPSQQPYEGLRKSDFFSFFNVHKVRSHAVRTSHEISLKPGGFQKHVEITVWTTADKLVSSGDLVMRKSWVIGPPMGLNPYALDIAKSFLVTFAPPQNRDGLTQLAATLFSLQDLDAMRPKLQDPAFTHSIEGKFIAAYIGDAPFRLAMSYCALEVKAEERDGGPSSDFEPCAMPWRLLVRIRCRQVLDNC